MSNVLVVDDETLCVETLAQVLAGDGHRVTAATSARAAIDCGVRCRPDVLVTDWMLRDDIHGLHVVQVLRAVLPTLRTILLTGFPSYDLEAGAAQAGVDAFLAKPLNAEQIRTAVRAAVQSTTPTAGALALAVVELDAAGTITFANAAARAMLATTAASPDATDFAAFFAPDSPPNLDAAVSHYVAAAPRGGTGPAWQLRAQAQRVDGGRLVVLRHAEDLRRPGAALVEMLLGTRDPRRGQWPFPQRVLVAEDETILRSMLVATLEGLGAGCYAVASHADALRLLEQDRGIGFLLLDYNMPCMDPAALVAQTRAVRPDVVIVGNSGADHRSDFAALGVSLYLEKPWRVGELIDMLTGKISNCLSCGLPLPLRRPRPDEAVRAWACSACGTHYQAVLDDEGPLELELNVRPLRGC